MPERRNQYHGKMQIGEHREAGNGSPCDAAIALTGSVSVDLDQAQPDLDHSSPDEQHFPSRVGAKINCCAGSPQKVTSLILDCVTLF